MVDLVMYDLKAENLRPADINGLADPYLRVCADFQVEPAVRPVIVTAATVVTAVTAVTIRGAPRSVTPFLISSARAWCSGEYRQVQDAVAVVGR